MARKRPMRAYRITATIPVNGKPVFFNSLEVQARSFGGAVREFCRRSYLSPPTDPETGGWKGITGELVGGVKDCTPPRYVKPKRVRNMATKQVA